MFTLVWVSFTFKTLLIPYKKYKIVLEGAGALANAIFISSPNLLKKYDYVIIPICGGNINKQSFNKNIIWNLYLTYVKKTFYKKLY